MTVAHAFLSMQGIEYRALQPSYEVKIDIDGEILSSGTGGSSYTVVLASRAFNTTGEHTVTITSLHSGTAGVTECIGLDRFR